MELFLRPLENPNDPVWSVIISIVILLIGVFYIIIYILGIDDREVQDHGSDDTPKPEELLQLSSDRDQSSSGRGYDRRDDRSGIRSLQEGESEDSGSGHPGEENQGS